MKGIGASPGIAIGKILIKNDSFDILKERIIDIESEIKRLDDALNLSKEQIKTLIETTKVKIGEEEAKIFEAHLMILDDPEIIDKSKEKIEKENINSEWAISEVTNSFIEIFNMMDNEYMKERCADLKDVSERIIKNLMGIETSSISTIEEPVILIAHDLTPSDTAQIDKNKVQGFVTEIGGNTSHTAIMARTFAIPAIVGADNIISKVKTGDILAIDGENGEIIINPSKEELEEYNKKKNQYEENILELKKYIGEESISKDGIKVELGCNIGSPNDLESVLNNDGEGIGLYRSEFLYMDKDDLPSEDEQFESYKVVAESLKGKPVVVRTLDIGGDKKLSYLEFPKEENPFLGYRAIRFCLDNKDIFKTQLRALLRASVYGNIKIMFPMISSLQELRQAKALLDEVKNELNTEDIEFNKNIEVGMMIEIPSAAIISDLLAKEVDFFSIGTNDLIQYTTAVDRMNQRISELYSPFHPAILRLIKTVIENGHKEGIWVGMCGEAAGNPKLVPILLGMGLDEFSMSPNSVLHIRKKIKTLSKQDMSKHIDEIINLSTAGDVENYINNNINIY